MRTAPTLLPGILVLGLCLAAGPAAAQTAPTITAPSAGATVGPQPTITWNAVTGATWYRVWIAQSASGANVAFCSFNNQVDPGGCWVQAATSFSVTTPLALGAYTLWVQAWSPSGAAWSSSRAFTVANRFEDRGLTVYDTQTGLEWEKKTDDGSIQDRDAIYTWSASGTAADGTAFTLFLAQLNGACTTQSIDGTSESSTLDCPGAGHRDWRLPTISELRTILTCTGGACSIDAVFGPMPPNPAIFWSSSTSAGPMGDPAEAWQLNFGTGAALAIPKTTSSIHVRAVRGGL